ncbi:protein ZINC INDUCED FACILITATOR-LIKE 1-like [Daucus carota subsp. sativus]|uniref:protein ZINC INDUCED FACILITATOR-LIKE 1-like n=1 Tax=Daucus carota subsp. sativus TaxID=79200 RepID=UPI0030827495
MRKIFALNILNLIFTTYSWVSIITGIFILQNKAVDQHQRGAANDIAMTAVQCHFSKRSSRWRGTVSSFIRILNSFFLQPHLLDAQAISFIPQYDSNSVIEKHASWVSKFFKNLSWSQRRQDAAFLPGTQIVFFFLNVVEAIGIALTFEPFLVLRQP